MFESGQPLGELIDELIGELAVMNREAAKRLGRTQEFYTAIRANR